MRKLGLLQLNRPPHVVIYLKVLPIRDLDATYLVEDFGTATKAIEYIMRTGSAFEKLLAQRIKPFLKGVKLVIVNNPERDIPNAKHRRKFRGATGLYAETAKGERTIYLSNIADLEGITT
jgi:hypothetical protein